jgi:hypothetical protein
MTASGAMLFSGLLLFFLAPIAQAAMVYAVSETILGRDIEFGKSLRHIRPMAKVIITAYLLYLLIALVLLVVLSVIAGLVIAGAGVQNFAVATAVTIFVLLIYIIFMMFLTIKYMFIPQAVVLDNTGSIDGLKRSYGLSTGYWWRTFGIYMIISIIVAIISQMLGWGVYLMEFGINSIPGISKAVGIALSGVIMTCISLFLNPVTFIATTLMYYDLRIRKEGFDLILLAESMTEGKRESSGSL